MYPLKFKIIISALLIVILFFIIYFSAAGFILFQGQPAYLHQIIPYIIVLLGVCIILSPILFAVNGPWIMTAVSVAIVSVLSIVSMRYIYNLGCIILGSISLILYVYYNKITAVIEQKIVAAQKVKEASNLAKADWRNTKEVNDTLSTRLDRYRSLREIGESFSARLSLEYIFQLAVDTAYEMIPGTDTSLLFMVDRGHQKLILSASRKSTELPKVKAKNGDIFDKWVFKERQPLNIDDISEDFRFDYKPLAGERYFKSLISVPIISQSRIMGIIRLNSREKNAYSFDDLRLLDFISDLTSSAINNARLYKTTEELSTRDSLTGFFIHRHMKILLYDEIERVRVNKNTLSVIMLDIDHFKDYNDRYGHSAGDKVILRIAHILQDNAAKHTNLIARYGGEEFVVILPNTDNDKARKIAENIRQDVSKSKFILRREETNITISAGVASYRDSMKDKDDLLKKADFLLYKAKKEGRNRVCAA
jgi:diguanylate cyclase (GGDEF)-like protein